MLVPFREENISSLGAAAQHNLRRTPARSQVKIPEGAISFIMRSTRQGSNDGEILYLKYIGCKTKRKRVQLHPLHPPDTPTPHINHSVLRFVKCTPSTLYMNYTN